MSETHNPIDRTPEPISRVKPINRVERGLTWLGQSLSDLVMPPVCLCCHGPIDGHDQLCPTCWSGIDFIRAPLCNTTGLPMPFDTGETMVSAAAIAAQPRYDRA
ncbi:MAG: double zinc ribbon domain-containing protein, partial [Pseudomonadota bacterium]